MTQEQLTNIQVNPLIKAVVVGNDIRMSMPKLALAMLHLSNPEVQFIGTNRADTSYPAKQGLLLPGGGSCIRWVEEASGICIPVLR